MRIRAYRRQAPLAHQVAIGDGEIAIHADTRYMDKHAINGTTNAGNPFTRSQVDFFFADSATYLNAHIAFLAREGRYRISVYGKNLTDRENPVSGIWLVNPTLYWGAPRQYGVELEVNF